MDVEILIENGAWENEKTKLSIEESAKAVFDFLELKHDDIEICFLCTDDEEVKNLNKTYRGIDKATNVLSFPADSYPDEEDEYSENPDENCAEKTCLLGSVALSFDTILSESKNQEKTFENHLRHLVVHSVLHLLGYDHIDDKDAEKMEDLEVKILKNMGLENPYQ